MLLYAAFTTDGKEHSKLFFNWQTYHEETWNPDTEIKALCLFQIPGKTYQQRKHAARNLAIEFQTKERPGLSWQEIAIIQHYFTTAADRYGLRREFSENGVI